MKTTKKHAIWFHASILYSIWYVCVGGGHINIFSGGPQSSSYGPAIISKTLQELDVLFPVKTWRNLFITSRWIIVMVSFQRRALDGFSSSRTLLPGFWLEPEHLSISHQSSGPYTGYFRIDFKVLLLVYKSLNGLGPKYIADMLTEYKQTTQIIRIESKGFTQNKGSPLLAIISFQKRSDVLKH